MDKVKSICQELGITQNELAELMGLHYTAFSKWKEKIPKNAEICLDLLVENYRLKKHLKGIKEAIITLQNIEKF
ncbi:helix-turn-helix transcriptional regulator [uncultured Helicobacter sp.]|uniref:helix-turn-helix domain-containing protein n=2 Tax=uncultured Helicobacter sp. TaxID=175537 RepID=UPI0025F6FC63|nr:helix-turn-helix transcriptional regulator [uncultured Helicobacter sp.]